MQRRVLQPFFREAATLPAKSALLVELLVRPDDSPLLMNGSGLPSSDYLRSNPVLATDSNRQPID